MKKKFLVIIIILTFSFQINAHANNKEIVILKKCVDGDTANFILKDQEIKVRFLAIDTDETVHPTKESTSQGKVASEYTCNKLKSAKTIELEYDQKSSKEDKYNRILAWIWIDNILLQKDLVENGLAEVKYLYGDYLYTKELYKVQEKAQSEKKGKWKEYIYNTYIIIFNEGNFENKISITEYNKIKPYIPMKKGYRFIGWYLDNNKFDFNNYITQDLILTAKFQKENYFPLIETIILILLFFVSKKSFKIVLKKKLKKII